ncbi:phenylalanine--tRNA ligase subunit alpha [Candidatus Bathyarchaeota archaeon]|nr:phenylalanine--tRNA ligase subunit alpha [Candidatus Bathyarchaeota archaeon]
MNPESVASELHENERKIISLLKDRGELTVDQLVDETGLSRDAIERACDWSETKGIISVSQKKRREFRLTEEGRQYAREGLPEKRLLQTVGDDGIEIAQLKERFHPLDIALAWVRVNEWGTISGGKLKLTTNGRKALQTQVMDEKILHKLMESPMEEELLDEAAKRRITLMLKRGLVDVSEATDKRVKLTGFGESVALSLEHISDEKLITQLTPNHLRYKEWREARFQRYDVTLPAPKVYPGKRHFISQVIDYIRRFWVEMGFKEMKGPILELAFWNFDALFQPQDHPARDLADTFYMKTPYKGRLPDERLVSRVKATHENGWETGSTGWQYKWDPEFASRCCLRTHTTSLSVNTLAGLKESDLPAKFFSVGRVFRNETIDWNHLMEFYQTDGIVVGKGVTFRNLLGYLKEYLERLGLEKFRFRPGYFPYTEMSLEAEVWIEEKQSWTELFGAGMFRPEVVKPLIGFEVPVLAWGPGFDRIVMRHYGINNIRTLYSNDIGQLREAEIWVE